MTKIVYSRINQAWFLMWNDQVLRIFNDKAEAELELARIRGDR